MAWLAIDVVTACPVAAQDQAFSVGAATPGNIASPLTAVAGFPSKTPSKAGPSPVDGVLVDNSQLVMEKGFGAQFWVVDSEEFFLNWLRTDVRNLVPVTVTRRGTPVYIAVFLLEPGSQVAKRGRRCDVTYDYAVLKPDGGCVDEGKNFVAWGARPPPPHIIQLAVSTLPTAAEQSTNHPVPRYPRLLFGVIDPPGEYIINVVVHDNVKKIDVPLQRKIVLKE